MARQKFMNTEIDNLTMQEALETIDALIQENKNAYVVTPNVDSNRWKTASLDCKVVWNTN